VGRRQFCDRLTVNDQSGDFFPKIHPVWRYFAWIECRSTKSEV